MIWKEIRIVVAKLKHRTLGIVRKLNILLMRNAPKSGTYYTYWLRSSRQEDFGHFDPPFFWQHYVSIRHEHPFSPSGSQLRTQLSGFIKPIRWTHDSNLGLLR